MASGARRARRLAPDEWWPANDAAVRASFLDLATGVRVRAISAGPARGEPVVLVHGWALHAYLWRRTIPALVAAGWRVHALDLPGHGLSEHPRGRGSYSVERMTAHLAAFLDAVGVTRAPIVAQSMGGRIAVELARRDPARVRALALLGSVGMGHAPALRSLVRYVPAPRHALASVRVPRWLLALNKTYAYGSRARVVQDDVDAYWAAMEFPEFVPSMRRAVIDFDWRPLSRAQLAEIGVPTLVMFGTRDRVIRAHGVEERVAALAAGELVWVADAGHLPNEEMPDTVNSILVEFIGHTT